MVEQKLIDLEKTKRPFSRIFEPNIGEAVLVDNTFAFRVNSIRGSGYSARLSLVANTQLKILTQKALEYSIDFPQKHEGVGHILLRLSLTNGAVYIGDSYKLSFQGRNKFQLQSSKPISAEDVPRGLDLVGFATHRAKF